MIDIHIHLLPAIDDGARTFEEAVAMAERAFAEGCTLLVATPHQRRDEWDLPSRSVLDECLMSISQAVPQVTLRLGAEVRVDSDLIRELACPDRCGILTLADSSYLLLEFDPEGLGPEPLALVEELGELGFRPVVAHPEVTLPLLAEEGLLSKMVEAGARLQVTAASLVGTYGNAVERTAWSLVEAGLVHLVASDAHRQDWRPPGLREVFRQVESRIGCSAAEALTIDNPSRVVRNLPLIEVAPQTRRRE